MKEGVVQVAAEVVRDKSAMGVAAGTIAVSSASMLHDIQGWLSLIGVFSGIILTIVLIRKHLIETRIMQDNKRQDKNASQ